MVDKRAGSADGRPVTDQSLPPAGEMWTSSPTGCPACFSRPGAAPASYPHNPQPLL